MDARLTLRRLLSIAAVAAAVVSTSGCGGGAAAQAAPKEPPTLKYSDSYVSFTYPAAWKAYPPTGPSELHFSPLVYLSTQPVGSPCSVHGNTTTCDWPLKHLDPGGALAFWQLPYLPGGLSGTPQGTQIQVGGRTAWRQDTAGGDCRRIGGDRTIDVMMPASSLDLTVCLRAPGLARAEKSVDALLASVKFASH